MCVCVRVDVDVCAHACAADFFFAWACARERSSVRERMRATKHTLIHVC